MYGEMVIQISTSYSLSINQRYNSGYEGYNTIQ